MFQTPELDIHKEIHDLLVTDADCTPLNKPFIHKAIRRTPEGKKVACPSCNPRDEGTIEGQVDCPYCQGLGFLWDESIETGWFFRNNLRIASRAFDFPKEVGRVIAKETRLLTLPDVFVDIEDRIYELRVDEHKRIAIPIKISDTYVCYYSERYASDQSDSEFNVAGLRI